MPTYLLASGAAVGYAPPAPPVAAFLERVRAAAEDPEARPAALVALVYGPDNPLLDPAPVPGHALIGARHLADPLFQVMADLVFRAQLRAAGRTAEAAHAGFTVSVADAARALGATEALVLAAIDGRKLAAVMRNGEWHTRPEAVAAYKAANRARDGGSAPTTETKPVPAGDAVRVRCGSAPGGSLAVVVGPSDLAVEGRDGDAVVGRFPAGWERALVRTTTADRVRVFELVPAPGAVGAVEHVGLSVRGPFRVARKYNSTARAKAAWDAFVDTARARAAWDAFADRTTG